MVLSAILEFFFGKEFEEEETPAASGASQCVVDAVSGACAQDASACPVECGYIEDLAKQRQSKGVCAPGTIVGETGAQCEASCASGRGSALLHFADGGAAQVAPGSAVKLGDEWASLTVEPGLCAALFASEGCTGAARKVCAPDDSALHLPGAATYQCLQVHKPTPCVGFTVQPGQKWNGAAPSETSAPWLSTTGKCEDFASENALLTKCVGYGAVDGDSTRTDSSRVWYCRDCDCTDLKDFVVSS